MLIRKSIPLTWLLFYNWPTLLIINLIAVVAVLAKKWYDFSIAMPISAVTVFSAALSIYLGFRSNNAYDRWWEARIIWGSFINSSRAWARQVTTMLEASEACGDDELEAVKRELIYRQIAFAHALRVFLRGGRSVAHETTRELFRATNTYDDMRPFLSAAEYDQVVACDNPPNMLLQHQGERLTELAAAGVVSDYRRVHLDSTLTAFNDVQGRSERIKNTAFLRTYSWFQRMFVRTHGFIVPFAYVNLLGWAMLPVAFILNYVFISIDFISSRTEDPFENRFDDVPLSTMSRTIEINLLEVLDEKPLPPRLEPVEGIAF
jgi:ion channel-forming bestrophin family protein